MSVMASEMDSVEDAGVEECDDDDEVVDCAGGGE